MNKFGRLIRGGRFWYAVVFFASFIVYLVSLPGLPVFEDSAEFVTAATSLGVLHPSGYPLYVLLAHPFSWLPFGSPAWRIALFSALVAAAALGLAYDLASRLVRRSRMAESPLVRLGMAAAILSAGFCSLWWSQAIYAKAYPLHALLILSVVWAVIMANERRQDRWLVLAALAYGLALANHFSLAAIHGPFLLAAAALARPSFFHPRRWRLWLGAVGAWLAGLAPAYLWMFWRATSGAPYIMGEINGWSGLVSYVLRRDYGDLGLAAPNGWGMLAESLYQPFAYLGILLAVLALVGLWRLVKAGESVPGGNAAVRAEVADRRRSVWPFMLAVAGALLAAPLVNLVRQVSLNETVLYVSRVYGLAAYPLLAVVAAIGTARILGSRWLDKVRQTRLVWVLALLVATGPVVQAVLNSGAVAAYRDPFPYQYAKAALASLPDRAVLLVHDGLLTNDSELFNLVYLQGIERFRTDVTVVETSGISTMVRPDVTRQQFDRSGGLNGQRGLIMRSAISDSRFAGRPLFATFPAEIADSALVSMSNGLVYAVSRPGQPPPAVRPTDPVDLPDGDRLAGQPALARQASQYLYTLAAWALDQRGLEATGPLIEAALRYDAEAVSENYHAYLAYRAVREAQMVKQAP